jgi:hypothetical protein
MKMRNRQSIFGFTIPLLFLLLINTYSAYSQPVQAEITLDSSRILIGDQIYLDLRVIQPAEARVAFPSVKASVPRSIEVLSVAQDDTSALADDKIGIKRKYKLTAFDTGRIEVPSFEFKYTYQGNSGVIRTRPSELFVQAVRVDTAKTIFDIKSPLAAPITFREALPYILAILGLAVIVLAVIYIIKKRKRREPLIPSRKPREPAHVYAIRELDKLMEEKLWQKDKIKLYYTRLTEILRTYLWMRYGIKTLERTTDEILESVKESEFSDDDLYRRLEDTLRLGDLVKFARMVPSPSENEESLNFAYEFVDKTKYIPEEKEEETSAIPDESSSSSDKTQGDSV